MQVCHFLLFKKACNGQPVAACTDPDLNGHIQLKQIQPSCAYVKYLNNGCVDPKNLPEPISQRMWTLMPLALKQFYNTTLPTLKHVMYEVCMQPGSSVAGGMQQCLHHFHQVHVCDWSSFHFSLRARRHCIRGDSKTCKLGIIWTKMQKYSRNSEVKNTIENTLQI